MASITGLGGEIVAFTYPSLIKVADNSSLPPTASLGRGAPGVFNNPNRTASPNANAILTDGIGQASSLSIGLQNAGAEITGPAIINGSGGNFTDGKLLTVCNGGAYIEGELFVKDEFDRTNSICGTTNMCRLNVDQTLTVTGCTTLNGGLNVAGGTSNFTGCATFNGGVCVAAGDLTVNGSINAANDITAFTSSDKRLKNNIIKIDDSNNVINKLNGYKYEWNEKSNKSGEGVGVIAQEVQELIPSAVRENQDGYLSVDYIKLIPYLIEEVKSLNNRIKTLESK